MKVTSRHLKHLHVSKANRGLPGKSYVHLIEMDFWLRMGMSLLANTRLLDMFVTSCLVMKNKKADRRYVIKEYFDYMSCSGEERVRFLFHNCSDNSKLIPRSKIISFIGVIMENLERFERIRKNLETASDDDKAFYGKCMVQLGTNIDAIRLSMPEIYRNIRALQKELVDNYQPYILKCLMQRRTGESKPINQATDAYMAMMDTVNTYNYYRSKAPLHKLMDYSSRIVKNKIINDETWGLRRGDVINVGGAFISSSDSTETEKHVHDVYENSLRNALRDFISSNSQDMEIQYFLSKFRDTMPKKYYDFIISTLGITEPLTAEEEIMFLL